ncbi:MAG: SH3 domain-containing protein [Coriobacteriia bacterium]|nr:SH3 domain-containing protein [Coriobacteriia bacterium]
MKYWVFESFSKKERATLHRETCEYCNEGRGFANTDTDGIYGKWHGPFATCEEAYRFADSFENRVAHFCLICMTEGTCDISLPDADVKTINAELDALKLRIPDARIEGGKLVLPSLSLADFKAKFPDISLDALIATFGGVEFVTPKDILSDFELPGLSASMPGVGVSLPGVDIKAPKIGINAPDFNFDMLKAAFPGIKLGGGKLVLPAGLSLAAIQAKFPGITLDALKAKFGDVEFPGVGMPNIDIKAPKVGIGLPDISFDALKAAFPGIALKGGKLVLPAGLSLAALQAKFPDITLDALKAKFGDIEFPDVGLPNVGIHAPKVNVGLPDISFDALKAAFPGIALKGGKLVLPAGLSLAALQAKFPGITLDALKAKFGDISIEGPDVHLPDADLSLRAPRIKKKKFPFGWLWIALALLALALILGLIFGLQKCNSDSVSITPPQVTTPSAPQVGTLSFDEIKAVFPDATFEGGKLVLPGISFEAFKARFPQFETEADLRAIFPDVTFNAALPGPKLTFDEVKAAFPAATLEGGKLLLPGVSFEDFKAQFPQIKTEADLTANFPHVVFNAAVAPAEPATPAAPAPTEPAAPAQPAASDGVAGQYTTTATKLNFRSGPGMDQEVLALIPKGTTLTVTGAASAGSPWYKTTYNGVEGYVHSDWLKKIG